MALAGTGAALGAAVCLAIGNADPAAISPFAALGNTIGTWCVANMNCLPGTMANVGGVVQGKGALKAMAEASDLGAKLATAMGDTSSDGINTWTKFATGLLKHMEKYGAVEASTFVAPTPPAAGPLTGTALVSFSDTKPDLATGLGVTDATTATAINTMGTKILTHIASMAVVVPLTTHEPFVPYTAPSSGPITGAGAMT